MHTRKSLTRNLEEAGISPRETLLVHSSMKSIGAVEGGADTVLDVFMNYFKKEGLLIFPTLSFRLNEKNPIFNVKETESQVGLLPEMFRKRKNVLRSLHPTHSVAAWGRDAAEFIAGHESFDTPCARKSPWGKLMDRKAKILFIGTGNICCNTFLHGVEEWFPTPNMFKEHKELLFSIDSEGNKHAVPSWRHQSGHSEFFDKIRSSFTEHGILSTLKFGDADCFLLQCAPAYDITMEFLKKDPQYFTHP